MELNSQLLALELLNWFKKLRPVSLSLIHHADSLRIARVPGNLPDLLHALSVLIPTADVQLS